MPPVAVNNCEPPEHMLALAGLIVPVGEEAKVIVAVLDAGPLHVPLKITTLYVPAVVAE